MNPKLLILLVFVSFCSLLISTTWHIKLDGTGDFTTIQEGINASVDTDTVLVYTGTYYENLLIENKNIILASQELSTGNPQYVNLTIIDGQGVDSCIWIMDCQLGILVQGFTIQHGLGSMLNSTRKGGGVLADNSVTQIISCRIINNVASVGGGLAVPDSDVFLSNNDIIDNSASKGGGISISDENSISFDSVYKNSVYNNNAGVGFDIYAYHSNHVSIIVDTFSITIPDSYYAKAFDQLPGYNTYFTFDIETGLLELMPYDLYVATNGNDSNSGLTMENPLRNISTAVRLIDVDENEQRTIHVAAGEYSWQSNQQIFPFGLKQNLSIIGEDAASTIIINDFSPGTFYSLDLTGFCEIANFSFLIDYDYANNVGYFSFSNSFKMTNCNFSGSSGDAFLIIAESDYVELDSLFIYDASSLEIPCLMLFDINGSMNNVIMDNCNILNNPQSTQSTLAVTVEEDFIMENSIFTNNYASSIYSGNIAIAEFYPNVTNKQISNCLFSNNSTASPYNIKIMGIGANTVYNCTFADNNSTSSTLETKGNLEINNSIFFNPLNNFEIQLLATSVISELDVAFSNILGGESSVYNQNGTNIVNWNEGNIVEDPLFLLSGDDPYQLTDFSPCIDAGTPDTTGLFIPPWDLLHNQRIWDGDGNGTTIIDMGCYEFDAPQYVEIEDYEIPNFSFDNTNLSNYPNPFNPETTITFNLPVSGKIKLEIFNIKGQKVKTLMDCTTVLGTYECNWNGEDEAGKSVSSGQYVVKLKQNDNVTATKIMLLK